MSADEAERYHASQIGVFAAAGVDMELDDATELDSGDPVKLAGEYLDLKRALPGVRVVGGCCGTDTRHIAGICERWLADAGSDC